MARRRKQVVGASRLRKKLLLMPDDISEAVRKEIRDSANEVLFEMQRLAPVGGDPAPHDWEGRPRPHIRDVLRAHVAKNGLSARVGLLGKKVMKQFFFAYFLEFGTRKMSKRPFLFAAWRRKRENVRSGLRQATVMALRRSAARKLSDE